MIIRGCLLLVMFLLCACSLSRSAGAAREEFEQSVKGYNRLLRWHDMDSAGQVYLPKELVPSFSDAVAELKKRGVTIADFRIVRQECDAAAGTGQVQVEFDYYILPSNRIKTQVYRQSWEYGDGSWRQTVQLPAFE